SSNRKADLNSSCAGPYTAIKIHLKSSFLFQRWNLIKNSPSTIIDKSRTVELIPSRIPLDRPLGGRQCQIKSASPERRLRFDLDMSCFPVSMMATKSSL